MKAAVCRPTELGPTEIELWHRGQDVLGLDHPFASPEYAIAVGTVDPRARVAVVRDGQETVALLPFTARALHTATALGGELSNLQVFIPCREDVRLEHAVRAAGIDLFEFTHLPAELAPATRSRLRSRADWLIDLSAGYEAYIASLKTPGRGKFVRSIERQRRRFEREHPQLSFSYAGHDPAAVAQLISWKSAQYRRSGWQDPFRSARARALVELLAGREDDRCSGCVSCLRSGERLVAVDISLRSERVFSGWFTAFDREFAAHSAGAVAMLHLIEATAAAGIPTIDLCVGDEGFKSHLASGRIELVSGHVGRASLGLVARRLQRAPRELAERLVLSSPRARVFARRTLRAIGSLRATSR